MISFIIPWYKATESMPNPSHDIFLLTIFGVVNFLWYVSQNPVLPLSYSYLILQFKNNIIVGPFSSLNLLSNVKNQVNSLSFEHSTYTM